MKKLLLILLCVPIIGFGQQTYVPDDNFETYLENNGMGDGVALNDSVLTTNINSVTGLYVAFQSISDLTGIEDFTSLLDIDCRSNQLTSIDLSNNINLTDLNCSWNPLTSLDVSNNPDLISLNCSDNPLTSLDVSNNSLLTNLYCNKYMFNWFIQPGLTSLDISNNPLLTNLNCEFNEITSLDVSNNPDLISLNCSNNQITSLDVSNNPDLISLNCSNFNYNFGIVGNQITNLDISQNPLLTNLNCRLNLLTSLDVSNKPDLYFLNCNNNQITSLDVSNNPLLTNLYCEFNEITSLDISNNPLVEQVFSSNNPFLTTLDLRNGNNINFDTLWIYNNYNLFCVDVDDEVFSTANWLFVDSWISFSDNCSIEILGCTDSLACNYDSTATINDNSCEFLNDSVIITSPSCFGISDGSVSVSISGGSFPYQYSLNGNPSQSNGIFTNLSVGTYSLVVTDTNGCTSAQTFTISQPNPLNANIYILNPLLCFGDSIASIVAIPDGGTLPYSFNWTSGQITDTISNLSAGNYTVFVIDNNGCSDFTTISINSPSAIISNNNLNGCDSVLVGSNYYSISGVYTDTLTSVNGCDSIVNTNLALGQNTASYDTLSVVASIVWNGMPLSVSGDYSVTLFNSVGCDSIVNLNLTITIPSSILNITNTEKTIVKITNMLGQETPNRKNTTLFYIYDDGTVEKRITID